MSAIVGSILSIVFLFVIFSAFVEIRSYYGRLNREYYQPLGYKRSLFGWVEPKTRKARKSK